MEKSGKMKQSAAELEQLVSTALAQLDLLEDTEASDRPSPDTWSKKEIIGHLIDSASNNHQRFVRALYTDKLIFPPYEQEQWVARQHYNGIAWQQLLTFWHGYNLHLAYIISHIPDEKGAVPCSIGADEPVSLGFLVEDYIAHMKLHFNQLQLAVGG